MPRPKGRTVQIALEKSAEVARTITPIFEKMNTRQRKLFVCLAEGNDELQSSLKAGFPQWFTGITKIVYTTGHHALETDKVSLENIADLEPESYERLRRICASQVRDLLDTDDYKNSILEIGDFFKLVAPDAFAVLTDIMRNGKSEAVRKDIAFGLLNRAGYAEAPKAVDNEGPIELHINFGNNIEENHVHTK